MHIFRSLTGSRDLLASISCERGSRVTVHTVKGVVFDDIDRGLITGMYHRARLLMSGRLGINT